jgi:hypothetical protein
LPLSVTSAPAREERADAGATATEGPAGAGGKPGNRLTIWLFAIAALLGLVVTGIRVKLWFDEMAEERRVANTITDFSAEADKELLLKYEGKARLEDVEVKLEVHFYTGKSVTITQSWNAWEHGEKKKVTVPGMAPGAPKAPAGKLAVSGINLSGTASVEGQKKLLEARLTSFQLP